MITAKNIFRYIGCMPLRWKIGIIFWILWILLWQYSTIDIIMNYHLPDDTIPLVEVATIIMNSFAIWMIPIPLALLHIGCSLGIRKLHKKHILNRNFYELFQYSVDIINAMIMLIYMFAWGISIAK